MDVEDLPLFEVVVDGLLVGLLVVLPVPDAVVGLLVVDVVVSLVVGEVVVDVVLEVVDEVVDDEVVVDPLPGVRYQLSGASPRHSPAVTPFQPLALIASK